MKKSKKKLSRIITIKLFIAVFVAFVVSSAVMYTILYVYCAQAAKDTLVFSSLSTSSDILAQTESDLFEQFIVISDAYVYAGEEEAMRYIDGTSYTYIAKKDGEILLSGNPDFIGKNVRDIKEVSNMIDNIYELWVENRLYSSNYMITLEPVKTLDGKMEIHYIAIVNWDMPDIVMTAAISPEAYDETGEYAAQAVSINRRVGQTGYQIVINRDNKIMTYINDFYNTPFPYPELIEQYEKGVAEGKFVDYVPVIYNGNYFEQEVNIMHGRGQLWDTDCFYCINKQFDSYILSVYPAEEALGEANDTILFIVIIEVVVFAVLFVILHTLIKRRVVRKLDSVNASLAAITCGDLEQKVEVRDSYEFDKLSTDINATVDRLKQYIAEAAARIDADLAVAKAIQSSALPNVFPPFPEKKTFDLYATMNAAKEVGGDFYDFFMIDSNTLGFLIADVSGKSIPGAMFMMTSNTVIKSLAESGLPPAEVFTQANEKLCEGNEAEMFVTAWLGYLDLKTGLLRIANAGHNPPVLIRDGKADYLMLKPGLMLAGMDGIRYKEQTVQLREGDMLFLYTDGVTEAMNKDEEQYGEDRLLKLLSFGEDYPGPSARNGIVQPVCELVAADVAAFTAGAEQSDDITMLCIRYNGGE